MKLYLCPIWNHIFYIRKRPPIMVVFFGADSGIWTRDLVLTKDVLYLLSHISIWSFWPKIKRNQSITPFFLPIFIKKDRIYRIESHQYKLNQTPQLWPMLSIQSGKSQYICKWHIRKDMSFALVGAAGRTRTDTVSLPLDFESSASANFTTAANIDIII